METRLTREVEKSRSVLARAGGGLQMGVGGASFGGAADFGAAGLGGEPVSGLGSLGTGLAVDEEEREKKKKLPQLDLTEEQRQMFEKGNQDMLKHYESTLDKVR